MNRSYWIRATLCAATAAFLMISGCADEEVAAPAETTYDVTVPDHECGYDSECANLTEADGCLRGACDEGKCVQVAKAAWVSACALPSLEPCERGACNTAGTCIIVAADDGAACRADEWDPCTSYVCGNGACAALELSACEDENPCTADACNPVTGGCDYTAIEAACDDGNACTGDDACVDSVCTGATNICECEGDTDCAEFEDDDACNGTLVCNITTKLCVMAEDSVVTCAASADACFTNTCDPASGACEPVQADACACIIDEDCKADELADLCAGTLVCNQETHQCDPVPDSAIVCPATETACTVNECNPATGVCESSKAETGTLCDDGEVCTGCAPGETCAQSDFCANGICKAGKGEPCKCTTADDCAALEDGDACNGTYRCDAGGCLFDASTIVDCSGQITPSCTMPVCNVETGACEALIDAEQEGMSCISADVCVTDSTCGGATCSGTTINTCNDDATCDPCETCESCPADCGGCD